MNEAYFKKNHLDVLGGKRQYVFYFSKNEFWKCFGCIISEVAYGKKGHYIWGGNQTYVINKARTPIYICVHGKTDLLRVRCDIYHHH